LVLALVGIMDVMRQYQRRTHSLVPVVHTSIM
jgi:hypothetical protein